MSDLIRLRHTLLAALGVAGCSASSPGGAAVDVEVPPPGSATEVVGPGAARPPRSDVGYVVEANGTVHRASATTCDPAIEQAACRGDEGHKSCSSDADCKDGPNGKCVTGMGQVGAYCGCEYACATDGDCKSDEACVCAEHAKVGHSTCAPASCKADADCPSGRCGVSSFHNGCFTAVSLTCRAPTDTCTSDADCGGGRGQCRASQPNREGDARTWSCQNVSCAIGRPFVVEGNTRTAGTTRGGGWSDDTLVAALSPSAAGLDAGTAAVVARHFTAVAALEHASVASFARASLELMALGAPPDLLLATHAAAVDEVRHARIAYAIARAHGAGDVGPGALDVSGALAGSADAARVARALAFEGCVGETLGAAEARAAAEGCDDPVLRQALQGIADDEEAHATLAWRTLAWLVGAFGDDARVAARQGIEAALDGMLGAASGDERGCPRRGVMAAADVVRLRTAVAHDVVAACAAAAGVRLTPPEG